MNKMYFILEILFALIIIVGIISYSSQSLLAQEKPSYKNSSMSIEDRVNNLLHLLTLEEKIEQLNGDETGFSTKDNNRLGIPGFKFVDCPHGVRWEKSTCFPVSIAMASTWDPDLVKKIGAAIAKEALAYGRNQGLAPCLNIIIDPRGGRSQETYGEDPFLMSKMAVAYIEGLQSQKVIATAKHFACNNQEDDRMTFDVKVDEKTLNEIFLPAFKACIEESNVWSVMSAYNLVNGKYCSENSHLLREILKNDWGFKGYVISDWGACHSTIPSIESGLDLEMPVENFYGKKLFDAVKNGKVAEILIDDAVKRILRAKFWAGLFDKIPKFDKSIINCKEHQNLAYEVAKNSIVLLKNTNDILPLNRQKIKSIAVIGPNASVPRLGDFGSSQVFPFYSVSVLDGIKNKVGPKVNIEYSQGCVLDANELLTPLPLDLLFPSESNPVERGLVGEYFNNMNLEGEPALRRIDKTLDFNWGDGSPDPKINKDIFSVRWVGKLIPKVTGKYILGTTSDDGVRLFINDKMLINDWNDHGPESKTVQVEFEANKKYNIKIEYYENKGGSLFKLGWSPERKDELTKAIEIAKKCDVSLVCVGLSGGFEGEGKDRDDLELPGYGIKQSELINEISKVNKNTIVVVIGGSAITMEGWIDNTAAILEAWYPGEQGGNAIADVLFGDYNPCGKLPLTFPKSLSQLPEFNTDYKSIGLYRGYRYYDKFNKEALFPFGYGLSFTKFRYDNLKLNKNKFSYNEKLEISLEIENTGNYQGIEIPQLYIHSTSTKNERPLKELKNFKRISLNPGEKKRIEFFISEADLSYYDDAAKKFIVDPGEYDVLIGSSSKDIKFKSNFKFE